MRLKNIFEEQQRAFLESQEISTFSLEQQTSAMKDTNVAIWELTDVLQTFCNAMNRRMGAVEQLVLGRGASSTPSSQPPRTPLELLSPDERAALGKRKSSAQLQPGMGSSGSDTGPDPDGPSVPLSRLESEVEEQVRESEESGHEEVAPPLQETLHVEPGDEAGGSNGAQGHEPLKTLSGDGNVKKEDEAKPTP